MKRFNKLQRQLLFFGLLAIVILISSTLYYMKAMTTTNADININKIVKKDRMYSYTVYSDFYYHIEKYNEDGESIANFSQIIPTETDLGYDFSKPEPDFILESRKRTGVMQLLDNEGVEESKLIDFMMGFSKEYSKIVAVQNQHYYDEVAKNTQEILKNLYHTKQAIKVKKIDDFYENIIQTPIENLTVRPYKLENIPANLSSFKHCSDEWCANLIEWRFGQNDRIYLQYFDKVNSINLDDYLHSNQRNCTIVKTIKTINDKTKKYFFKVYNKENAIDSYMMDENGYIYLLKYRAQNRLSYDKYLFDYLKIAFGIYFNDTKNFNNTFAKKQDAIRFEYETYQKN